MPRQPLILSSLEHDIHAHSVCWGLRRAGLKPIWAQSVVDENMPSLSLYCDSSAPWRAGGWLDDDRTGAIWYRRPKNPEHFTHADPIDVTFIQNEWARVLKNVYALPADFSDRLWINSPPAAINAENKLVQLRAARRCGLQFPPTLISHDPEAIRQFAATHGRVLYKCFMPHAWRTSAGDRFFSAYASVVDPALLDDDESLSLCPGIYQAYVEKQCDLRIVVIGDQMFTLRMGSADGGAFVDWRAHQNHPDLVTEPITLPAGFQDKVRSLMQELGLASGSIDVVLDTDGQPHFLEINQAGQFLFVENHAGTLPLLRAMCALLATGRPDYSLDAIPAGVSYAAYLESEEHQRWWARVGPELEASRNQPSSWVSVE